MWTAKTVNTCLKTAVDNGNIRAQNEFKKLVGGTLEEVKKPWKGWRGGLEVVE